MNQLEILLKLKNETQAGFAALDKSLETVKKQTDSLTAASATASGSGGLGGLAKTALVAVGGFTALASAATMAVFGVKKLVSEYAAAASGLVDLNKQLGIGVVEIQKIQYAAKVSGVDFGAVTTAIMQMEKAASKTPEKFAQLGISFGALRTARPDELLALVSDGLKNVTDANERARVSMEIFGRGGSQVLKLLLDDYRGLLTEAEKTGLITDKMAQKGDALDDSLVKVGDAVEKLKLNLGAAFANPAILKGMDLMVGLIGAMARNADKLVTGLTDSMPGIGLLVRGYNAFAGDGPASPSSALGGVSDVRQYALGKGGEKMPKALADLDKAFDKLARRMDNDAVKAAEKAESAEVKLARARQKAIDDFRASFSYANIPDGFVGPENPYELKIPGGNKGFALWNDPSKFNVGDQRSIHIETQFDAVADAQNKAAESSARWAGALQGVALMAGAIGGKLGDVVGVMENIGKSFENWDTMTKTGKFNAIAGGVGQIGGLIGGTGGSALQGAAGGAMTGFALGGPVGAAIGGVAGGIMGLFGGKAKQKAELAELRTQLEGMRETATRLGIDLSKAFSSKNPNELKAAIEQVNKAMEAQQKRTAGLAMAAGGFNAFVGGGGVTDQGSADRSGLYATAIFGSMVKDTGDVAAALQAISPALSELAKKAEEMGLSLGEGVSNLIGMNNVLSGNDGLAQQVSGLNQMMKGLADANIMNRDLFAALGADATAVFNQLIAGGATGNQALALMQPTLQQLYEGQKLYGFTVDETTQKLLDEAKAQGLVGDQFMSANERMVELLGILIETLGGTLPAAYKRAALAAEEYGRRATGSVPTGYHVPPGVDEGSGGAGFASGTAFRNFGSGTRTTLHGEEAVMRRDQVDRLVSMAVSGAPGSTVQHGGGRQMIQNTIYLDGRVFMGVMTEGLRTDGKEAQDFRQAYSGVR